MGADDVKEGVLYRRYYHPNEGCETYLQLIVPKVLREYILADVHEGALGGHLGIEKILGKLKEWFYWPGHYQDVQNWCNTCSACASRKFSASGTSQIFSLWYI